MDKRTADRLNAINRAFYPTTAGHFDESRQRAWPGWERLTTYLRAPLWVLCDRRLSCGWRIGRPQPLHRAAQNPHFSLPACGKGPGMRLTSPLEVNSFAPKLTVKERIA